VFWLILLVACLNLGLGYAAACCLGFGPPGLIEAWEALSVDLRPRRPEAPAAGESSEDAPDPSADTPLGETPDLEAESAGAVEPSGHARDEDREDDPRLPAPAPTDCWDLDEKYVEASVLKLNVALIESGIRANAIDAELRAGRGRLDTQKIRLCTRRLREDCQLYLDKQAEAAERLCHRLRETEALGPLADQIETANRQQSGQIEATLGNLDQMDFAADPEETGRRLLEELGRLRAVRHQVRDRQEAAFLAIARHEGRLETVERRLFEDPLTELPNRIGLECTLHEWFQQGRHTARQLSAALFDLDRFGALNEEHGPLVAERILYHLAGVLREHVGEQDLAGRFGGQRFLVVLSDVGPRTAIKQVELLRQSIARITFRRGESTIRVTARAGIAEVKPEDADDTVLRRLEEILARTKEEGPDSSFVSRGAETERVESPNLGAEYVEMAI